MQRNKNVAHARGSYADPGASKTKGDTLAKRTATTSPMVKGSVRLANRTKAVRRLGKTPLDGVVFSGGRDT